MKQYCHYHPLSQATWLCENCQIHYDKLCMPDADDKLQSGQCPQCHKPLKYLDRRSASEPFWNKKQAFLSLLVKAEPLLAMVILSLMSLTFPLSIYLAIPIALIIAFLATNFARHLARTCENDNTEAPTMSALFTFTEFKENLIITLTILAALGLPLVISHWFSPIAGVLLAIALMLPLPALLLMMIYRVPNTSRRRYQAPDWQQIIKKMGGAYFTLTAYFGYSFLAVLILRDLSSQNLPEAATVVITTAASCFALWFNFSVLGYILLRYEGFLSTRQISPKTKTTKARHVLKTERFDADLDIAIKSGNYELAISLLETVLKKNPRSDLRRQQLYKLVSERKDLDKLEQYAEGFLELLLARGQTLQAYELVAALRQHNEAFQLHNIELIADLAETLNEMKEYALVLWLAEDCTYRMNPSLPLAKLQLRAAKTLLAKHNNPKQALQYLRAIDQYASDSEIGEAGRRLMKHIKSLGRSG